MIEDYLEILGSDKERRHLKCIPHETLKGIERNEIILVLPRVNLESVSHVNS